MMDFVLKVMDFCTENDGLALQPSLGFFDGKEDELPYDYDDLLAEVGSTPMLVYQQVRGILLSVSYIHAGD